MDKELFNLIQERMPEFKPVGYLLGINEETAKAPIKLVIDGLPESIKHLVDQQTGSIDLVGLAGMKHPMNIKIQENTGNPIHAWLRTWMPQHGTPYRLNAGEPLLQGNLKCGLSWEWLKWARDFYGISLVAAKRVGEDFLKEQGDKLYGHQDS